MTRLDFAKAARIATESQPFSARIRSTLVFAMCRSQFLIQSAPRLISLAERFHLSAPLYFLIRHSFFAQFCGGRNSAEVSSGAVSALSRQGIGLILDLSVEADLSPTAASQPQSEVDRRSDDCASLFIDSVLAASASASPVNNCVAAKVTALGRTSSLLAVSGILSFQRDLFEMNDSDNDGHVTLKEFSDIVSDLPGFSAQSSSSNSFNLKSLFNEADSDNDGRLSWFDFTECINITRFPLLFIGRISEKFKSKNGALYRSFSPNYLIPECTAEDLNEVLRIQKRVERICQVATEKRVGIMIDAEQSYFQPAIDQVAVEMMKKFNKNSHVVVYNTFQLYLKNDGIMRMLNGYQSSLKHNFAFGAKLVRGAYMESERKRAADFYLRDPINKTIEQTHQNYNNAMAQVMEWSLASKDIRVVFATHNKESVLIATQKLQPSQSDNFGFAQLMGMHDDVTFALLDAGFKVSKYVPYGPVNEVIPYLLRRAQENSAIFK